MKKYYTYSHFHWKVMKARGKAAERSCVDCGEQAKHWSRITNGDWNDPFQYEPRCPKCHYWYDRRAREANSQQEVV